jgi:hypothetical protein
MPQGPIPFKDVAPGDSPGSFQNFAANTAGTQIKTGPGTFLGLNVNTVGTGAASITLYDGTSTAGPIIGIFSTLAVSMLNSNPITFVTGLFAVVAGTTSGNITVIYL